MLRALFLGALALLERAVDGAIIGIDFGSNFIKVASVRPGTPFHIVLDEQSKRKIDNVIGFDTSERYFGNHASQMAVRKPSGAVAMAVRLLGKRFDSPDVQFMRQRYYPYTFVELEGRNGAVGIQMATGEVYSPEDLVGMMLEYILKISTDDSEGQPVKDAVITVPDYWTHVERLAMLDAAQLAGVNVLSLIDENTAVATQYGIDVKFEEGPFNVIFFNMGANSLQVNLVEYSSYASSSRKDNKTIGQFEVIAKASDPFLGAQSFDHAIMEKLIDLANEFFKSPKGGNLKNFDIRTQERPMGKLRAAAEKTKTVLSANVEVPVNIGSLHNDRDFKTSVTREAFNTWVANLYEQSMNPIKAVLEEANLKPADIKHVVLVGGGVRIPGVQKKLKEFFGREELAQNLNGDEAMCFGAVFRAANISTAFKTRKIGMVDATLYPVGVRLSDYFPVADEVKDKEDIAEEEAEAVVAAAKAAAEAASEKLEKEGDDKTDEPAGVEIKASEVASDTTKEAIKPAVFPAEPGSFSKRATLFKRNNQLAKRKTVAFTHNGDVSCVLTYDESNKYLLKGTNPPISIHNVTGVNKLLQDPKNFPLLVFENEPQKPRIALSFSLDSSGIVTLVKAEATLDEMIKVAVTTKVPRNTTTDAADVEEKGTNETETAEETEKSEDKTKSEPSEDADESEKPAAEDELKKEDEAKDENKKEDEPKKESEGKKERKKKAKKIEYDEITEYKEKKKTHHFPLKVVSAPSKENVRTMTRRHLRASRAVLKALKLKDDSKKDLAVALNELETYVYFARNSMSEEAVEEVTIAEQREVVVDATHKAQEWMSELDSSTASPELYRNKTKELQKIAGPIFERKEEMRLRPSVLASAADLINLTKHTVAEWNTERPWIPVEDREKLRDMGESFEEWIANKTKEQSELQAHESPAFHSSQVQRKMESIAKLATDLSKLKKPAEKKT